ncbi:MAG TPA: hypothetical protein VD932_01215 [Aquabacterium sp.]|nr:hypothetical protein [Aquabacterium sp.]
MTTAMLTMPAPVEFDAASGLTEDDLGLPGWLYRSEAFAEDLQGDGDPLASAPRDLRGLLSAVLYPAAVLLAVLATLPSALALV